MPNNRLLVDLNAELTEKWQIHHSSDDSGVRRVLACLLLEADEDASAKAP